MRDSMQRYVSNTTCVCSGYSAPLWRLLRLPAVLRHGECSCSSRLPLCAVQSHTARIVIPGWVTQSGSNLLPQWRGASLLGCVGHAASWNAAPSHPLATHGLAEAYVLDGSGANRRSAWPWRRCGLGQLGIGVSSRDWLLHRLDDAGVNVRAHREGTQSHS